MNNMDRFKRRKRTKTTITMEVTKEQVISSNKLRKVVRTILGRERMKITSKSSVRNQFALLATRSMLGSAGRTIKNALVAESSVICERIAQRNKREYQPS